MGILLGLLLRVGGQSLEKVLMLIGEVDPGVKRKLKELARESLDAELREPLEHLAEAIEKWKAKTITNLELDRIIYDFEQGDRKKLSELYDSASLDVLVARAIARGILNREKIPQDILDILDDLVKTFEKGDVSF